MINDPWGAELELFQPIEKSFNGSQCVLVVDVGDSWSTVGVGYDQDRIH